MQVHIGSIQYLCTYLHSYTVLRVFSLPILCATAGLACIAMPHLNIDTSSRVVFLKSNASYLVHKL